VSGQLHVPGTLLPGKSPQYPLDRRLGGPQIRSGRLGEEEILDPTRTCRLALSQSLYRRSYPGLCQDYSRFYHARSKFLMLATIPPISAHFQPSAFRWVLVMALLERGSMPRLVSSYEFFSQRILVFFACGSEWV
jgi:hypothetical protein